MNSYTPLAPVVMLLSSDRLISAARRVLSLDAPRERNDIQLATSINAAESLLATAPCALLLLEFDTTNCPLAPKSSVGGGSNSALRWLQQQHSQYPRLQSTILSRQSDAKTVIAALGAGASGYLVGEPCQSTAEIIRTAVAGMNQLRNGIPPLSDTVLPHIVQAARANKLPQQDEPSNTAITVIRDPRLSKRENEVLALAAKGFTYAEMARLLNLSIHTISTHTRRIYAKLEVNSRCAAIYEATQREPLPESSAA